MGHVGNYLRGRRNNNNKLSRLIGNDVGVFRDSPFISQVFIIYDENVMNEYTQKYSKQRNKSKIIISGGNTEHTWGGNMRQR